MSEIELTHIEAVRNAWRAAVREDAAMAQAWAAVAAQLPFIAEPEPEPVAKRCGDVGPDGVTCIRPPHLTGYHVNREHRWEHSRPSVSDTVLPPRPLERAEPTNVRGPAELEREQAAADAALRGEPVPDPRPVGQTAVPRPGSRLDEPEGLATCMCGLGIYLHAGYGWLHVNGGVTCPS